MRVRKTAAIRLRLALALFVALSAQGHAQPRSDVPVTYGGISGVMETSNTVHISVELANAGEKTITALRGRVEVLNDFGEVSATLTVELTSRTRKEVPSEEGRFEVVPFQLLPGETIHYVVVEWQDYSNETQYYVQGQEAFEYAVEREHIVPLDPDRAAASRFVVSDIVYAD
ncbi:MAG: hypothetical protein ACLFP4_15935 [Spirochaetales bacterium]